MFLAGIGSAASIGNALSRIIWGGIGDKLGFKVRTIICVRLDLVNLAPFSYFITDTLKLM
jgi:MFS family permease